MGCTARGRGGTLEDGIVEDETVKDETAEDETVTDATVEDETVGGETAEDVTVKDETVGGATAEDEEDHVEGREEGSPQPGNVRNPRAEGGTSVAEPGAAVVRLHTDQ